MNQNSEYNAYQGSLVNFVKQYGVELNERVSPFQFWLQKRRTENVWPYGRITDGLASFLANVADDFGQGYRECINFGSQDYLGLASDQRIVDVVKAVVDLHGVHSAGSPALTGRTSLGHALEQDIASIWNKETAILFPTGWSAGFGVLAGLVRENDYIIIDELSHNCIQEGAIHRTKKVKKFKHNNLENLEGIFASIRKEEPTTSIFLVFESLYSMDSDTPDIAGLLGLCRKYSAISIVDVAHDFGSMGYKGLGALESVDVDDYPDVIAGSFSKTFATNGGFVACSKSVKDYLAYYAPSHIFSNAISPMQIAIAKACFDIVFSDEGLLLRKQAYNNICLIRACLEDKGFIVGGTPSPIVPVYVGTEKLARLTAREMESRNLIANLVEFPAVPRGKARFRLQVMATHAQEQIMAAAEIMGISLQEALKIAPEEKVFSPLM